ncbi:hypothetical protein GCM10027578_31910 [Spirosoma luteolum]
MKRALVCSSLFGLAFGYWGSTLPEALAFALSIWVFLTFLDRIGDRLALLDCISFIAALELLLVPAATYWIFPASMPVDSDRYFGYALPAYLAFYAGISWFSRGYAHRAHADAIRAAADYLQDRRQASLVLLLIGVFGFTVRLALPGAPALLSSLPASCLLVSALYAYYAGSRLRWPVIGLVLVLQCYATVREGMFGDLFFWMTLLMLVIAAGHPTPLATRTKTLATVVAFAFLLLIQSVKGEYRRNTWGYQRSERSGNAGLMGELIADRLANPEKILTIDHFFSSFMRFNQGVMIGSAMGKVPLHEPYAQGEVLLSFVYPFVPRLVWPGKPQTGGYENIRRFTSLPQFENTSINLSPVGEGYVNFGYGGILFAGLYGLMLSFIFRRVLDRADARPSLVLWLPVLYIGCLTMETDLLSTWGSLANALIFVSLLYWGLNRLGISL